MRKLWFKDLDKAFEYFWNTQRLRAIVLLALILPMYIGLDWTLNLFCDWVMMIVHPLIYGIFLMTAMLVAVVVELWALNNLVRMQRARAREA